MGAGEKKTTPPTTTTATATATTRLKREECKRTKHDSSFSDWKILVGPSDWEDYLQGKEGAEKYRTQNLPNSTSSPGVYELGIVVSRSRSQRKERKVDPNYIIPVYLGQADNVRNRLQQYGREGAHLEKVYSNREPIDCKYDFARKAPGLFTDIFSRGYSIVYRWAPIENKREAENTEAQLLNKFDYAWNKDSNGQRRHNDILKKLDRYSKASQLHLMLRKLQVFPQKKMGIKIKVCERHTSDNGSSTYDKLETNGPFNFSRILKFGKSQPRLVSLRFGVNDDYDSICGVALGHGLICTRTPIEGRKRCTEHKGMKVNGFTSKLSTNRKSSMHAVMTNCSITSDLQCDDYDNQQSTSGYLSNEDLAPICGFIMDSGCPCTKTPVHGNKRCLEHKGRRICKSVSQTVMKEKKCNVNHHDLGYMTSCDDHQHLSSDKSRRVWSQAFSNRVNLGNDHKIICGVGLEDGTPCMRSPVVGRKRCEEHKGMRVKAALLSY